MFFVSDLHKDNFLDLLNRFPAAHEDPQYKQACYIVAVPEIYQKAMPYIGDSPVSWIFRYLEGQYDIDFTRSYRELIKCAVHLWNGYEGFSLYEGLSIWDAANYQVFKTAIDIAKGIV